MEVEEAAPQPAVDTVVEPAAQPLLANGEPALLPPQVCGARWRRNPRCSRLHGLVSGDGRGLLLPESGRAEGAAVCIAGRPACLLNADACVEADPALCAGTGGAA